jgi:lysophospholipase L1-like esterase
MSLFNSNDGFKIKKLETSLAERALQTDLNSTNTNVSLKADKTYVDTKFGNMGNTKTFKGSCLFASLPTSGNTVDDYWYVTDRTSNYCWNGSAWADIGNNLNLADGTITGSKTDFLQLGNLYNKDDTTTVGYFLNPDGTITSSAGYNTTYWIAIKANTTYGIRKARKIAVYNSSKTVVQFIDNTTTSDQFITPTVDGFLRVSVSTANLTTAQIVIGSSIGTYFSYGVYVFNSKADMTDKVKTVVGGTAFLKDSKNMFNPATRSQGYVLGAGSGNISSNSGYDTSAFIPVIPNSYSFSKCRRIAVYDTNQVFVTDYDVTPTNIKTITVAANGYVKVSFATADMPTAQMELGNTSTEYVPYGSYETNNNVIVKENDLSSALKSKINNPANVNPLSGKTLLSMGDSIPNGANNNGVGYPHLIATNNGMIIYNQAISGSTLADVTGNAAVNNGSNPRDCIQNELTSFTSANSGVIPDYILLEGGTNDILYAPLGAKTSGYNDTWDKTTMCGGLESLINRIKTNYPTSKLLYVCVHNMGTRDINTQKTYHDAIIDILKKWSVPVVDLYSEGGLNTWISNMSTTYTDGGTHPNQTGYNLFYVPPITAKMKTL